MQGTLLSARKELLIQRRDRWAMLIYLALPLTIGLMVIAVSGGGSGPQPVADVLVVDEDESFLSRFLLGALSQERDGVPFQARAVSREEGRSLIDDGDATALLVIPAGFGQALLDQTPAVLELVTNPAQQILPGIVEETLKVLVDAVFYLHQVFGDELQVIGAQIDGLPDGQNELFEDALIAQLSISINNAVESITAYLDPPVLDLAEPSPEETDGDGVSFGMVFFPGTIFIGLLFAAKGLGERFWIERESGTLRRELTTTLTPLQLLAGKLLAGAGLFLVLAAVLCTAGWIYLAIDPAFWLPSVLWLTLSGLVLFGIMTLIQLLAPNRRVGRLITDLLLFILMMAGGAFFPFESMPEWIATLGRWVPNGFLLEQLKQFLVYGQGIAPLLSGLPIVLAMGLVLWGLCAWRIDRFAGIERG